MTRGREARGRRDAAVKLQKVMRGRRDRRRLPKKAKERVVAREQQDAKAEALAKAEAAAAAAAKAVEESWQKVQAIKARQEELAGRARPSLTPEERAKIDEKLRQSKAERESQREQEQGPSHYDDAIVEEEPPPPVEEIKEKSGNGGKSRNSKKAKKEKKKKLSKDKGSIKPVIAASAESSSVGEVLEFI